MPKRSTAYRFVTASEGTNRYAETVNGVPKIALTLSYTVPEGCTFVKTGFVVNLKTAEPTLDTGSASVAKTLTGPSGAYTLHISVKNKTELPVYARAYLVYLDADGEQQVLYTPAVSYVWTDLNG